MNDGVEIKYVERERPSLRKGAIPTILPGCPSYYTKKPVWATRLSLEEKDEELFYIARNLSLEILGTEGIKYKVNYFSDIKDRLDSSYPDLEIDRDSWQKSAYFVPVSVHPGSL